jgi:long-chain acyl-CoA synthetase
MNHHATAFNLASVLEHGAFLTPNRTAITCCGVHLTYAELDARASSVAAGLASLGIVAGDHVALSCPNVHWFPIAYFGILKAGAVVVPLNVLLKPREIAYHLHDSEAKAVIAFEGTPELPMAQMARAACDQADCRIHVWYDRSPQRRRVDAREHAAQRHCVARHVSAGARRR